MNGSLLAREDIDAATQTTMHRLLARHFFGVGEDQFEADLADKTHVVLLERSPGELVGFSTFAFERIEYCGKPLDVVTSGDTIMDPAAWQSSVLSRTWIEAVLGLHREHGVGRLVWLLITSGFRTYRFLPVFWKTFYPRFDATTPVQTQTMIRALAYRRYGDRFDACSGVVRFDRPQVLRPHLAGIPARKRLDPHVAFFDRANPRHIDGDELVCLTEITQANLTSAGRRMVRTGRRAAPEPAGAN